MFGWGSFLGVVATTLMKRRATGACCCCIRAQLESYQGGGGGGAVYSETSAFCRYQVGRFAVMVAAKSVETAKFKNYSGQMVKTLTMTEIKIFHGQNLKFPKFGHDI